MNFRYFQLRPDDPRLAYEALYLMESMATPNPEFWLRGIERLSLGATDKVSVLTQNSLRPACVVLSDEVLGNLILLSGTEGALHVPGLLAGWLNPRGAVRGNGANPFFENAVFNILESLPANAYNGEAPTRIFGFSLGGGVAQVMAAEFVNNLRYPYVECITYAAPRAGTTEFQRVMGRVHNTRWFADDDPVRFMPPHVDEVPSVLYFQAIALFEGMNTQVHCPTGYQLEANGNIARTEGEPTRLHSVVPSIINWITDTNGFQSVNHARQTYLQRLSLAIQNAQPAIPVVQPVQPEPAFRINIGNAAYWEEQAQQDVVAAPELVLPAGQTITVTRTARSSRLRYVRRKRGGIWTVQYNNEVVAIGPGKRRAGQIARSLNRTALVP